jgi:hypothetical protein
MKRNRSTLRDYFKKGAIPTEANFADLIDSMINQDEDSLSKLPNDPLHITANGADEGLINFYRVEQGNPVLTWHIKQKPDGKSGFSIGEATANKLFIESNTGNVGIGTTIPANKLHINGNSSNLALTFTNSANTAGKRGYRIAFDNDRLTFQRADDTGGFVANQMSIMQDTGNIGIGTTNPLYKLHVVANGGFANENPDGTSQQGSVPIVAQSDSTAFGIINASGRPAFALNIDGNTGAINERGVPTFYDRFDGAWHASIFLKNGNVGIGAVNSGGKLDIKADATTAGGWYEAIRFSQAAHSAITHPGGGLLFGLHGNRNFYFADIQGGAFQKYVMQIEAATGNIIWGTNSSRLKADQGGSIELGGTEGIPGIGTPYIDFHFKGLTQDFNTRIINDRDGQLSIVGNVKITGTLGTNGIDPRPRHGGWGGGIHTWDIEAEGTVYSKSGYLSVNQDLAENYHSDTDLEPGDVVCFDPGKDKIVASEKPNDPLILGVISTAPGFLLNAKREAEETKVFPVALGGRVSCKVIDENGSIKAGDLLTSSSTPGYAMKSHPSIIGGEELFRPGTIIGKALGMLESGKGMIDVFVFPG